jgi:hypothetical protein
MFVDTSRTNSSVRVLIFWVFWCTWIGTQRNRSHILSDILVTRLVAFLSAGLVLSYKQGQLFSYVLCSYHYFNVLLQNVQEVLSLTTSRIFMWPSQLPAQLFIQKSFPLSENGRNASLTSQFNLFMYEYFSSPVLKTYCLIKGIPKMLTKQFFSYRLPKSSSEVDINVHTLQSKYFRQIQAKVKYYCSPVTMRWPRLRGMGWSNEWGARQWMGWDVASWRRHMRLRWRLQSKRILFVAYVDHMLLKPPTYFGLTRPSSEVYVLRERFANDICETKGLNYVGHYLP